MKSLVLAGALAAASLLVGSASGRPVDVKRAITTEVVFVTATMADVIVYVDENGVPYSTTTQVVALGTTPAAVVPSTTSEVVVTADTSVKSNDVTRSWDLWASPPATVSAVVLSAPTSTPSVDVSSASHVPTSASLASFVSDLPPLTLSDEVSSTLDIKYTPSSAVQEPQTSTVIVPSTSAPASTPSKSPTTVITEDTSSNNEFSLGITYDPFEGPQDQARCKTEEEIHDQFSKMTDYKIVRIYGMGCNIVPIAVQNAVKNGQKLFAGAYLSTGSGGEDLGSVIQALKNAIDQYAGGNWGVISLFSVENERVNAHDMTASAVVDAIQQARGQLRGLGYQGPITAVETVPAMIDNSEICKNSDVVTVNCHAFFDPNTKAEDAGTFVKSQVEQVKQACGTDRVIVTESGWPHQGDSNGNAVPSPDNQRAAIKSLRDSFNNDLFFFNAFDSLWKSDWASSFNAERYWGVIQ